MVNWSIVEKIKIIAGSILVVAAFFNLFGGALYAFTGASNSRITITAPALEDDPTTTTPETATQNNEALNSDGSINYDPISFKNKLWLAVGVWFGLILLIIFVLQVAAAVMLFLSRERKFVIWVGILGFVTETIGIYFFSFKVLHNGFGIVGSILAILASALIHEPDDVPESTKIA